MQVGRWGQGGRHEKRPPWSRCIAMYCGSSGGGRLRTSLAPQSVKKGFNYSEKTLSWEDQKRFLIDFD